MLRPVWLALGAGLLGACSESGTQAPPPQPTTPQTSVSTTAVNPSHGYTLTVPTGWATRSTTQAWTAGHRPDVDTPGFDTFESATGNGGLLAIGRRPVRAGTTPRAWMSSLRREGSLIYSECGSMGKVSTGELAGGTAIRVLFPCPDEGVNAELVFAVHGRTGWAILCAADDTGTVPLTSVCGPLIDSFRFA